MNSKYINMWGFKGIKIKQFYIYIYFGLFGPSSHQPIYDTVIKFYLLCRDQIFSRLPRAGFETGTAWLSGCYANRWPNPTPFFIYLLFIYLYALLFINVYLCIFASSRGKPIWFLFMNQPLCYYRSNEIFSIK